MANDDEDSNGNAKQITKSLLEDLPSTAVQSIHLSTEDGRSVVENVDEEVFVWKDFKQKCSPLKLKLTKQHKEMMILLKTPKKPTSTPTPNEKERSEETSKENKNEPSPTLSKKSTIIDERQSSIDSIKKISSNIKHRTNRRLINKTDEQQNEKDNKNLLIQKNRTRSSIKIRSKSKTKGIQRNRSTQTINSLNRKKHLNRKKAIEKRRISKTKMVNSLEKK